jgi:hypothetical protein
MAKPRLVELAGDRFLYCCDACGKEWETMTKEKAHGSSPPFHTCPLGPKPREDASQAAAVIVREAAKKS